MKITFDITDPESDIIAEEYGYNADTHGDKSEFVLEQFKIFGRKCIESKAFRDTYKAKEIEVKDSVDAAKAAISF